MGKINNSIAISDKYRSKYGNLWANIDFDMKFNSTSFRNDPINTTVGTLHIDGKDIKMSLKYLLELSTLTDQYMLLNKKTDSDTLIDIRVSTYTLNLKKHELSRLNETLADAKLSINRSYELATYL